MHPLSFPLLILPLTIVCILGTAASAYVMLGKHDDSVSALVLNIGKEKFYCVKSLYQARFLVHSLWSKESEKFKAAVNASYPLASQFCSKPKTVEEATFETPKGE